MCYSNSFRRAASDLLWLIDRKYPRERLLRIVADRYSLSGSERTMLYRGWFSGEESRRREKKLLRYSADADIPLTVDLLNQLFTVAGYLRGIQVFIATDGWVRDTMELHGKMIPTGLLKQAAELFTDTVISNHSGKVVLLVDRQHSQAEEIVEIFGRMPGWQKENHTVTPVDNVDTILINSAGILATSDTRVIDRAEASVLDLAAEVLFRSFNPDLPDLRLLMKELKSF
ncbi:MAG: hypothetical protein Kow00127_00200 [Bacteroidales bacterium]